MQNAAAGWLMAGLTQDAFIVSLVQVATMLPVVLLGLPAGALADIMDRRKLLIAVNGALAVIVAALGSYVWLGRVTPEILLIFTFLVGAGSALIAPAWQAIVPSLVPRKDLQAAISLNSVGVNISRAVGPALAGIIIGVLGLAAPFWLNALSTLGVIAVLLWWRPAENTEHHLPPERFHSTLRIGWRHARPNRHLTATLMRAAGFFVFASAYWALLPLVARDQIASGPQLYGLLLGTIGVGAVGGAFLLPWLKYKLGPDKLVAAATAGTALALLLFGLARSPAVALAAAAMAGQGTRPRHLRHRPVRGAHDARQRILGPVRKADESSRRPFFGLGRRAGGDPDSRKMATADRSSRRPHAVPALARARAVRGGGGGSRSRADRHRIQDRTRGPGDVSRHDPRVELGAPARRRL
jgi:MFS family permease